MTSRAPLTAPLLAVEGLRIAFGANEVVHGVDFQILPGEKLALVGESGSGKTITALSLLGLAQGAQVSGSARFAGPQGATAPGCPTFIQSTQPTLGELNGFTTYAWWDTSQTDLTLWIEDGD